MYGDGGAEGGRGVDGGGQVARMPVDGEGECGSAKQGLDRGKRHSFALPCLRRLVARGRTGLDRASKRVGGYQRKFAVARGWIHSSSNCM